MAYQVKNQVLNLTTDFISECVEWTNGDAKMTLGEMRLTKYGFVICVIAANGIRYECEFVAVQYGNKP